MAKAQAKAGPRRGGKGAAKAGKRKARRGPVKPWVKVLVLMLLFPFAAVLLPTTLLIATLMAPTWVAYIIDRSREKYLAITVGMLNFAGTLPAVIDLWTRGQSHDAAMQLLADLSVWITAYGSAFAGWAIFVFMPSVVSSYYRMTTQARIMNIVHRQKALIAEWGHSVADGTEVSLPEGENDSGEDAEAADEGEADDEVTEAELVEPIAQPQRGR